MKSVKKTCKIHFFIFLLMFTRLNAFSADPPFLNYINDPWVNEQLQKMTLEEKIAQLMFITVYPELGESSKTKSSEIIKKMQPGGILVMKGNPSVTAKWINEFQDISSVPLLVSVDGEWGLSMRIDSTVRYPYAQAIGAVSDSALIFQMGKDIARQMKIMGIQMNFAPVADINTNPANPVINFRSFGEDKLNVAQKAWWLAKGMQVENVIPVAKHFPGHGDTDSDSHHVLPFVNHSKQRLDTLETFPFRYLSERGICGIMSAHLNVPAIDKSGTPSSLSEKIISDYLINEIGFKGFVVTDAINMKGVRTEKGNAEAEALIAGNDIVEFVPDLQKAILSVKEAVKSGRLTEKQIEEKCTKVLALKRWTGLNNYRPADLTELTTKLNNPVFEVTNRQLLKNSFTVLKNDGILPIQDFDTLKIASLMIGSDRTTAFQDFLSKYTKVDHFFLPKNAPESALKNIRQSLANYNLVIIGVQGVNIYPGNKYGTTEIQRKAVDELVKDKRSVIAFFGNAYAIQYFSEIHKTDALILAYQNTELTQELAAQLVFGAFGATGKLPVTIDTRFKLNSGVTTAPNQTLSWTIPEEAGINSELLNRKIDSVANLGIEKKAYPGCQVLIAKDGKVILQKSYGWHTYDKLLNVQNTDLYDWASVTKVTSALPSIMKLADENRIDVNQPLSNYWPAFKNSNKENIKIAEFLTHQAGLPAWIPFWMMVADKKGNLKNEFIRVLPSDSFLVRVSEKLYLKNDFKQFILDSIRNSKLGEKKYVYSDLSFLIYPEVITKITGKNYEDYLQTNFYSPLGATTVGYNPYRFYSPEQIIPTELDTIFRKQLIHGFVHDESAAMLGGVSGNAGLFGCAGDLAKIFQIYLQKGFYGGKRYFSEETINQFTKVWFPGTNNRRALGFDKPLKDNKNKLLKDAYPAIDASPNSFGHTGFTGNIVWADPDNGLLYIFLSNRVYPTRDNSKISDLNIRVVMHQEIYNCIKVGINQY